jgi:hypothetical protein
VWVLNAAHPGERANDVTNTRDRENEEETCAQKLNSIKDLANARPAHKVGKQKQAYESEDNSKWRKSPAPTALLTQNIVRHRSTVPHSWNSGATVMPPLKVTHCLCG